MKLITIKENHLFGKAYAKGKRFSGRTVSVYVLKDYAAGRIRKMLQKDKVENRYGISVSKKVGGAVERNRGKRVIRAGLYSVLSKNAVKGGFLVVLSVRGAAVEAKSTDAEKDIYTAFCRLGLIEKTEGGNASV